jgi:hypothetical protein
MALAKENATQGQRMRFESARMLSHMEYETLVRPGSQALHFGLLCATK